MRPRSLFLLAALAAFSFACLAPRPAAAGNGDELASLARHHHVCRYGDPRRCAAAPHHPCPNCQMSWQPVRSMLHPNMMPAGMLRPWPPLNRKIHNLLPKMPLRWLQPGYPWSGCDGHCGR